MPHTRPEVKSEDTSIETHPPVVKTAPSDAAPIPNGDALLTETDFGTPGSPNIQINPHANGPTGSDTIYL